LYYVFVFFILLFVLVFTYTVCDINKVHLTSWY